MQLAVNLTKNRTELPVEQHLIAKLKSAIEEAKMKGENLPIKLQPAIKRAANKFGKLKDEKLKDVIKMKTLERIGKLEDKDTGFKHTSKLLNGPGAKPLLAIGRKDKTGTTTNPSEVDAVVREAWQEIYKGNVEDQQGKAEAFMQKYAEYIFKHQTLDIGKVDHKRLAKVCQKGKNSACGLDNWHTDEFALLSDAAFWYLEKAAG